MVLKQAYPKTLAYRNMCRGRGVGGGKNQTEVLWPDFRVMCCFCRIPLSTQLWCSLEGCGVRRLGGKNHWEESRRLPVFQVERKQGCASHHPFVSPQPELGNMASQKMSAVKYLTFVASVAGMRRELEMEFGLACCPSSTTPRHWWWWVQLSSCSVQDRTQGIACPGQTLWLRHLPDLWWDRFQFS